MADVFSRTKRSEIMSRVGHKRTAPEEAVASLLRRLRIRFKRNVRRLSGQPDFVIAAMRTVVFVNGCFWHGHRGCRRATVPATNTVFWLSKFRMNARRDRANAAALRGAGWCVITVWECSLSSPAKVAAHLKRVLSRQSGQRRSR
jgi:DNA mismatch endonuclease (patch repair protein)